MPVSWNSLLPGQERLIVLVDRVVEICLNIQVGVIGHQAAHADTSSELQANT